MAGCIARMSNDGRPGSARRPIRLFSSAAAFGLQILLVPALLAQTAPAQKPQDGWRHFPAAPRAPEGAPNVLLILTDDVGYSAASTFGGAIPTPTLDDLAKSGLRYTRMHQTAMCSPTRAALLTGRNHHAVGFGAIANVAVDEEGYTSVIPKSAATIGRVLRDNGYDTAFFGKNHNTPDWEGGPLGPFDRWPNALGFNYFYGFNGPATDQFNPDLVENINPIRRDPADKDYILDRDLADKMLRWLDVQHTLQPDKPFFLYLAPGSMHGPQQAPADWIARFKGKFDSGWDAMRDEIFARQKRLGIIPKNAALAPVPEGIPRWDSLTAQQKRIYARLMEVAAAQLAFMDDQIGRVINRLRETGQLDNTMVIFIQGDNGAAMHAPEGSTNIYSGFSKVTESEAQIAAKLDKLGLEDSAGLYPSGFAYATNTPFPWGKTFGSHLGGIRNGMVISWPKMIADRGGIRTQFGHVIDIAPTIYDAIGITPPEEVDGVKQQPIHGISLAYSFTDAQAPSRRREQYFEMIGNRSYYKDGWLASTVPAAPPWKFNTADPNTLQWELYDLNTDYSQTRNVAADHPEKLAELKASFDLAADKYHVYPLASDYLARLDPKQRPAALPAKGPYHLMPGDTVYPVSMWPNITRNWSAVSRIKTASAQDSGPIFTFGTRFTGYALALEDGVPVFTYNPTGRIEERRELRGTAQIPAGDRTVTVNFVPEGKGVRLSLSVDGVTQDSAVTDRFDRVVAGHGQIGRSAIDDTTGPALCDCQIEEVVISMPD
ncbi:MAG: arylsulfatase [Alphaproteobacteria bacterium]|nr:arylsulfatase [Alphaproteobacteria bacterium]MBU0794048.1 arylsulfatase [Alphaproteobacteria bacterium]MBU0877383.1 arylsulfatase [Alphaproteobacteria bacterium]MBU1770250.1 arylsulfatase [Alphaproteobacteria bacterium]